MQLAVDCALASVDRVIVSSDSEEIFRAAILNVDRENMRRLELRQRPAMFATSDATSLSVVKDAIAAHETMDWDALVLLQPTSPLRLPEDVTGAVKMMADHNAEAVVSVAGKIPEGWLYELGHAGRLRPAPWRPGLCMPNGAVYALSREAYEAGFDWDTALVVYGYEMPKARSIDIDTAEDLDMARRLATNVGELVQ